MDVRRPPTSAIPEILKNDPEVVMRRERLDPGDYSVRDEPDVPGEMIPIPYLAFAEECPFAHASGAVTEWRRAGRCSAAPARC
jgi:hypothetical protein